MTRPFGFRGAAFSLHRNMAPKRRYLRVKPLDRFWQTCQSGAMAKFRSSYVCQNCGAITQRWQGKCESCGEWNTIIEEAAALGVGGAAARRGGAGRPFPL